MALSYLFLSVYILLALINTAGELTPARRKIRYCTTPLALPLLIAFVLSKGHTPWMLILGLFFSLIGDVILMFPEDRNRKFFLWGTLSFLLTHLVYIYYFLGRIQRPDPPVLIWILIGVVFAGTAGLLSRMWKNLGFLKIPVGLYSLVLACTASVILLNYGTLPGPLFYAAAGGILLFLLSDSGLSQYWFIQGFPLARPFAMITYFAAQLLIVLSLTGILL